MVSLRAGDAVWLAVGVTVGGAGVDVMDGVRLGSGLGVGVTLAVGLAVGSWRGVEERCTVGLARPPAGAQAVRRLKPSRRQMTTDLCISRANGGEPEVSDPHPSASG